MTVQLKPRNAIPIVIFCMVLLLYFGLRSNREVQVANDPLDYNHAPSVYPTTKSARDLLEVFIRDNKIDQSEHRSDHDDTAWKLKLSAPPKDISYASSRNWAYVWVVKTNRGTMKFRLRPDWAPYHVTNTIYLTLLKFYDGIVFHRVIRGFMAQFGCPLGQGSGGPGYATNIIGYQFGGEFLSEEATHRETGMLSTANAGPNTDGSQLFILFAPQPHLNGKHTVFGEMIDGHDTLRKIEKEFDDKEKTFIKEATVEVLLPSDLD